MRGLTYQHSSMYSIYRKMVDRCSNPKTPCWKHYGGRGITVCDRWLADFANFLEDMSPRPRGTSLDRRDNSLGYSKENCRWATQHEQTRNTRRNVLRTLNGETLPVCDWAARAGLPARMFRRRLERGWSLEKAMSEPRRITQPPRRAA